MDFKKVISNCALVAGVGDTANGSAFGFATTAQRFGDELHGVFVETVSTAVVTATPEPFHLIVACGA